MPSEVYPYKSFFLKKVLVNDIRAIIFSGVQHGSRMMRIQPFNGFYGTFFLGFNHLLIYDNLSNDNLAGALSPFIASGLVRRIKFQGLRGQHTQVKCYNDALRRAKLRGVHWLAAFDVDEFIALPKHDCLPIFLKDFESNASIGGVALNWRWIPSEGRIWRERTSDGDHSTVRYMTVMRQAKYATGVGSDIVKSIVLVNRTVSFAGMHHANYIAPAVAVTPSTRVHVPSTFHSPPDIDEASLLHFHTRTFEEFLFKIERWKSTSYFISHCPNCESDLDTLASEYLHWLNSTNQRAGLLVYEPRLRSYVTHGATEAFMKKRSQLIDRALSYCDPRSSPMHQN